MERRCGIGNKRQNPSRLAWKNMAVKKYHEQTVDKLQMVMCVVEVK